MIPAATVTFLRDRMAKTYKLMLGDGAYGQLVKLYGPSLPDLAEAEDMMIALVNAIDDLDLKDIFKSGTAIVQSLTRIRSNLYNSIPHQEMAKKVDTLLKRISDHIWKDTKRIVSCTELKGTPYYTWNAGPGGNPTKPVPAKPKSPDRLERERILDPSADQIAADAFNRHKEKENYVPTFDEYETNPDKDMT